MGQKVVVAHLNQIDWQSTFAETKTVDAAEQIVGDSEIFLVDVTNHSFLSSNEGQTYLPVSALEQHRQTENAYLYNDLELYPFYQEAKSIITQADSRKGVFRLRRVFPEKTNDYYIAYDLLLLEEIFGEPEQIFVKRTDQTKSPQHVIVTINYGDGTMAHLDYTFEREFHIELEWSGIGQIIEFNSNESTAVYPNHYSQIPLSYSVESILEMNHKINDAFIEKLEKVHQTIVGGDHS